MLASLKNITVAWWLKNQPRRGNEGIVSEKQNVNSIQGLRKFRLRLYIELAVCSPEELLKFLFRYVQRSSFQNFIFSQRKMTSKHLTIVFRCRVHVSPPTSGSYVPSVPSVYFFLPRMQTATTTLTCFVSIQTQNPRFLLSRTHQELLGFEDRNEEWIRYHLSSGPWL